MATDEATAYYANNVQFRTTNWDITMIFGREILEDLTVQIPPSKTLCSVSLSPPIAKLVASLLQAQVAWYEANIGPIPESKRRADAPKPGATS